MAERFRVSDFAYAHRGLWTKGGLTENSLDACLAAADLGLGIEFDVRPSADGVPVVFHDPVLERMTSETGAVEDRRSQDLIGLPLKGGGEVISLQALLESWPGTTPLLCEMKIDGPTDPSVFTASVASLIDEYPGPAAMMSFSTEAVAAIQDTIMRGQLIAPTGGDPSKDLSSIARVEVDYLACHTDDASNPSLQAVRHTLPLICWTVTTVDRCAELSPLTDSQMFEAFDPALAKRHILNT